MTFLLTGCKTDPPRAIFRHHEQQKPLKIAQIEKNAVPDP